MTFARWLSTVACFLVALGVFVYATSHIHSGWGLVILAWLYVSGFWVFVNTIDLLFGRWIRRGKGTATPSGNRVILEETVAPDGTITRRIISEDGPQAVAPKLSPLAKAYMVSSLLTPRHRDEMQHGIQWRPQDWN